MTDPSTDPEGFGLTRAANAAAMADTMPNHVSHLPAKAVVNALLAIWSRMPAQPGHDQPAEPTEEQPFWPPYLLPPVHRPGAVTVQYTGSRATHYGICQPCGQEVTCGPEWVWRSALTGSWKCPALPEGAMMPPYRGSDQISVSPPPPRSPSLTPPPEPAGRNPEGNGIPAALLSCVRVHSEAGTVRIECHSPLHHRRGILVRVIDRDNTLTADLLLASIREHAAEWHPSLLVSAPGPATTDPDTALETLVQLPWRQVIRSYGDGSASLDCLDTDHASGGMTVWPVTKSVNFTDLLRYGLRHLTEHDRGMYDGS